MYDIYPLRTQTVEHNGTETFEYYQPTLALTHSSQLDLDDFNVENAYFRSFDIVVRRQLDPVWHKVGPKTKQLVSDLGTLRQLL
jgi:hypothetical protein